MSKILLALLTVHDTVHDSVHKNLNSLLKKMNYSIPKIFTGGCDIAIWSKLSPSEQEKALSKDWYIYYSFRDVDSGKLKRMPNIKAGVNKYKTKSERLKILNHLRDNLEYFLEKGLIPYIDNDLSILNEEKKTEQITVTIATPEATILKTVVEEEECMTVKEAFDFALKIKKSSMNPTSYSNYSGRINRFKKAFDDNKPIKSITLKLTHQYLNDILEKTSPRNRNNSRVDINSLFEVLANNEIIADNFIKKINILKSVPERNKTYTPDQLSEIFTFLDKNDPILALFIKFISYNLLRPVEVCRLKIGDIDIKDKKLYVRAKNQPVKIKIIPDILLNDLPDLTLLNPNHFLFTPTKLGDSWIAEENNKRDYFSKRFKTVIKDTFNLGIDYGMYSFRHTFITKLYRQIRKEFSPFEAKSKLMLITGHSTMSALEKYLRDIDAELPEDYSHLLK
ncbi:MAG: site-specific integrase [Paludibacter sp.]|nr:site-specific integrase [Paludibacter sp.]